MGFDKTSVYHSALVRAGEIRIKVTGSAFKSKYPDKEGKAGEYLVGFQHDGKDHLYLAEHKAVAFYLGKFNGQEITIRATGANEGARIEVLNSDGTVNNHEPPTTPTKPEEHQSGGDPEERARKAAQRAGRGILIALEEAGAIAALVAKSGGKEMTPEQFQAITSTIFINMDKNGVISQL